MYHICITIAFFDFRLPALLALYISPFKPCLTMHTLHTPTGEGVEDEDRKGDNQAGRLFQKTMICVLIGSLFVKYK